MSVIRRFLIGGCLGLALGAPAARAAGPGRLVALVADKPITVRDLRVRLLGRDIDPDAATRGNWQEALNASIARAALLAVAEREKIVVREEQVTETLATWREGKGAEDYARRVELMGLSPEQERRRARDQLHIEALLAQKVGAKLFVPPKSVAEWYTRNKDLLALPETRVARVMTAEVGKRPAEEARAEIDALRQKVLDGADFAALAKERSGGPWAEQGGLLEPMLKGQSGVIFADRVFGIAKPGDVTDVFESGGALHFLRLEEVRPGKVPTFEEARDGIRQRLRDELWEKHVDAFTAKARRETPIRVFWHHLPAPKSY